MGRVVAAQLAFAVFVLSFTTKADTKEKHCVAVLPIETRGVAFSTEFLQSLEHRLATTLKNSGWRRVIPPEKLKSRCATRSCHIEKAQEAGAEMFLIMRLERMWGKCKLASAIYDLKSGEETASIISLSACTEENVITLLDAIGRSLAGTLPFSKTTKRIKAEAFELVRAKRYKEAIDIFREALDINPNNCAALFGLGLVYAKMGKREESNMFYKRFRDSCPLHLKAPGDYPIPKEFKRPGDYFIDYKHIRG